ncbi:MAG: 1-acyl-sn-glycerol-3-phosphate acyltransferase [Pseudomonadota bacterium]
MLQFLRSLVFQVSFLAVTLALSVAFLPSLLMPQSVVHFGFRLWARALAFLLKWICGADWQVLNAPTREGAFIAAGKHQSAWETLMLSVVLKEPAFVLKKELMWLPFIGWYIWKMDMIPIDRSAGSKALRTMLKAAKKAKEAGRPIVIFPEGTRVAPGTTRPYQPGIAALYRQLELPILPFALNSGLVWPRNSFHRYPGFITLAFQPEIPSGLGKKDLIAALESAIEPASQALLTKTE